MDLVLGLNDFTVLTKGFIEFYGVSVIQGQFLSLSRLVDKCIYANACILMLILTLEWLTPTWQVARAT